VRFLRLLEGAPRLFEGLFRHLMGRKMIFHPVMRGRNPVRVRCLFVHFGRYSMRIQWQTLSPCRPAYTLFNFVSGL
jgi:hypothetical protein